MRSSDFKRGAVAAAAVASSYDATSAHPYLLGDCILSKLNIRKRRPRRNQQARLRVGAAGLEHHAWLNGYAIALAEMHRRLLGGNDSLGVCAAARAAGLTLKAAKLAGVNEFDLKELKKAGVQ